MLSGRVTNQMELAVISVPIPAPLVLQVKRMSMENATPQVRVILLVRLPRHVDKLMGVAVSVPTNVVIRRKPTL